MLNTMQPVRIGTLFCCCALYQSLAAEIESPFLAISPSLPPRLSFLFPTGINAAIVLLLLLISVPLQLLLTNVVTVSSDRESNEKDTRADAINR